MVDLGQFVDDVANAIYAQYEKQAELEETRGYLGASQIGKECERALWYDHRWATKEKFEGRMLRLFETGHLAEPRFIKNLRDIGCEVYDADPATGRQFSFTGTAGHAKGHMDGCGCHIPGGGDKWHVLEFKTHSSKSFADLKKNGVKKSKPQHFIQIQWYMGKSSMTRALYLAVNKDTDELHSERIEFDPIVYEQIEAKFQRIIFAPEPPSRLSEDSKFYLCNWCSHNAVCHNNATPDPSCRTCVHSTVETCGDGAWTCELAKQVIPITVQRTGCPDHLTLPFLVTYAVPVNAGAGWIRFQRKDNGKEFYMVGQNMVATDKTIPTYTSAEIAACKDHRAIGNAEVESIRSAFQGEIVG